MHTNYFYPVVLQENFNFPAVDRLIVHCCFLGEVTVDNSCCPPTIFNNILSIGAIISLCQFNLEILVMNQYILEWINEVCLTLVLDENDSLPEPEDPNIVQLNVESMDVKEKMLMIGKVTFGDDQLIMPKLYENYCEYLTNYKNTSEYDNNTDIVILQEVCFLCAVHEKSIDREFFIENIMNLKSESQIYMMEIIKQQQAELNEDNDTNDSCAVDNEVNVPKKEKSVLQTNGSSACEDESGASGDVLENTTANIDVGSDVTSIKTLENDITNLNNKLIDMELLLLEKDDIISSTKLQVEQIQSEYNELLSREAAQSQIINEYELIKDDLGT